MPLTKEQQEKWFDDEICNRNSYTRFWGIDVNGSLVGYGGIENIQWQNSIGEISLLVDPEKQAKGYGTDAETQIINNAFYNLNLKTIYAECYDNNPAKAFWDSVFFKRQGIMVRLPNRKYWNGKYYDGLYYSLSKI
jgi:RimJ/RimL family protein N-acetyltransferase